MNEHRHRPRHGHRHLQRPQPADIQDRLQQLEAGTQKGAHRSVFVDLASNSEAEFNGGQNADGRYFAFPPPSFTVTALAPSTLNVVRVRRTPSSIPGRCSS